jgi:hypothetical protein
VEKTNKQEAAGGEQSAMREEERAEEVIRGALTMLRNRE